MGVEPSNSFSKNIAGVEPHNLRSKATCLTNYDKPFHYKNDYNILVKSYTIFSKDPHVILVKSYTIFSKDPHVIRRN